MSINKAFNYFQFRENILAVC